MKLLFWGLLIFGAVARFAPHPANFAPIASLGIFAGLYGSRKQALILPLAARLVSDALIGFFSPGVMLSVYLATFIGSLLGIWAKKNKSLLNIALATLLGSISFYLLTNAAVWLFSDTYVHNSIGLVQSYTLALPFFRNTLLGDAFYVTLLVGSYELVKSINRSLIQKKITLATK